MDTSPDGQISSPSQGHKLAKHTHVHPDGRLRLTGEPDVHFSGLSEEAGGRKDGEHSTPLPGFKPGTFLLWGNAVSHRAARVILNPRRVLVWHFNVRH